MIGQFPTDDEMSRKIAVSSDADFYRLRDKGEAGRSRQGKERYANIQ